MNTAQRLLRRTAVSGLCAASLLLISACGSTISLDEPIEGPVWRLVQLAGQPVAAAAEPARNAHVQLDLNGRVTGSGGCNRLSGTFVRNASQLRLSQLGATRMACADSARGQLESQFFQALQSTASYRLISTGQLALLDASGRTLALLQSGAVR